MAKICSLRPNVTRDQAVEKFSSRGPAGLTRSAFFGPLRSVADFYIPFRVFRLDIRNRGRLEQRFLAVDSANGTLMPYSFSQPPTESELLLLETRNHAPASLPQRDAADIAITKVQRLLFATGFFRVRGLKISAEPMTEIHVPYWIGFRGRGERANFTVVDAVRRRVEGAKVRHMIQNWLTLQSQSPTGQMDAGN
jgi:hypothetical protein